MSEKQKSIEREDLVKRENELRKQIEESRVEEPQVDQEDEEQLLNYRTYFTSLIKGRVTDIQYNRNEVILEVQTKEGVLEVPVDDTGDYSEGNELVRLLEWKNIPEGRIGDLLDEKITITLARGVFDRSKDADEFECSVRIPSSFDLVGKSIFRVDSILRRVGINDFENVAIKCDATEKIVGSIMVACFISVLYIMSVLATIPVAATLGKPTAYITAVLMTVLIGIELRLGTDLIRRYKNYRAKDKIRN